MKQNKHNIFWCKNCLNNSYRPRIGFDENGWCNACQWSKEKKKLNWKKRILEFKKILKSHKSDNNYDCIVPVSGGKDGSYVSYKLREHGLNVLTVTSRPPLETSIGNKNLLNFVSKGFDHVHITANNKAMQRLNKLGFIMKGSPYYGWLVSVFSSVIRTAITNKINLVFYSEHGEIEYGGSAKFKNTPLFDLKQIIDTYFEGGYYEILKKSKLSKKELYWFELNEDEIKKNKISLTHWSYFEPWDSYRNYQTVKKKFNIYEEEKKNDGTYTNFAQNDQALYSLHAYLMYLKFGFGRGTQDVGIDIRRGALTREQGINLVNLYDREYPSRFIDQYLDYFEMKPKQFDKIIDFWANKKILKKVNNRWIPKFIIK